MTRPDPARELRLDARDYHQDRFIVKFREGLRARLAPTAASPRTGRTLTSPDGLDLRGVWSVLATNRIERLFTRDVADLDRERAGIRRRNRARADLDAPADLNNFYRVFTAGARETRQKILALLRDPAVETAYPEFHHRSILPAQDMKRLFKDPSRGKHQLPPIQTPFFEPNQTYLGPAPGGLGIEPARGVIGVEGDPSRVICHVEGAWTFGHEDTPQLRLDRVLGSKSFYFYDNDTWRRHGTAVVGVLTASRDPKGVRGIVPRSTLWVVSLINKHGVAFSLAAAKAGPGDVLTSSAVQGVHYQNVGYHAPIDLPQDAYDAIRNATLKGIIVTLAGGNTGADLGTKDIFGTRYLPQSTPSGAYIVGATLRAEMKRVDWSNHGHVVQTNGWGSHVSTCGYGHLFSSNEDPERRDYTSIFGGTSAAAPQVAGVAAALQSAVIARAGKPLDPQQVLDALKRTGTPIAGGVGTRPNLYAALHSLGVIDGLRLLDEAGPGQRLPLGIELQPQELFILLGGVSYRRIPWPGLSHPFAVDPAGMVIIGAGSMPVRSPLRFDIPLPPIEFMQGQDLYYQAVRVDLKTQNLDVTNGLMAWLRSHRPPQ